MFFMTKKHHSPSFNELTVKMASVKSFELGKKKKNQPPNISMEMKASASDM